MFTSSSTRVRRVLTSGELFEICDLMHGGGRVDDRQLCLLEGVRRGARSWKRERGAGEMTRDQRRRWNAAVRRAHRVLRGRVGVAATMNVPAVTDPVRLLDDHDLLVCALVAALAHGERRVPEAGELQRAGSADVPFRKQCRPVSALA